MSIDPIQLEVIANRLDEIQRVMKHRLFHTGYSVILRESFDGSAGLTDSTGQGMGAAGLATHMLGYAHFVKAILKRYGTDHIHENDSFITNDPYLGGTSHTQDVAVATPAFVNGTLIAFCVNMGHKPDMGGLAPGTGSPSSRSIFHEGMLIPPVKLYERGILNQSLEQVLRNNSRTPELLMGDVQGQVGCSRIGAELIQNLCQESGVESVKAVIQELLRSSETRLRKALLALPDGEADAQSWLDGNGITEDAVRVYCKIKKIGDSITVDFTGTDRQSLGPVNAVSQVTKAAALIGVLSVVDHTIAFNEGLLGAVNIISPGGTVVNPQHPAPVNSYMPTTHLALNCVLEALGKLYPERAVAESGLGLGGTTFGYKSTRHGSNYVHYEIHEVGFGGTSNVDGAALVMGVAVFETIQPIEILEAEFPVRITDFSIWKDSAGAGKNRGGVGYIREFEVLEPCHFVSRLSGRRYGAKGVAGGGGPKISRTILKSVDGQERPVKGLQEMDLMPGDRIRIEQSGGAGWGDPRVRAVERVLEDVADGYLSPEAASEHYGVVVQRDDAGRFVVNQVRRQLEAVAIKDAAAV